MEKSFECDDVVSRQAVLDVCKHKGEDCIRCSFYNIKFIDERTVKGYCTLGKAVRELPSVRPQEQTGHCKECKYFEYDSVAKVDGVSLIVAHEICNKWGYGCKTREDGYCYLFEPQESEERDASSY